MGPVAPVAPVLSSKPALNSSSQRSPLWTEAASSEATPSCGGRAGSMGALGDKLRPALQLPGPHAKDIIVMILPKRNEQRAGGRTQKVRHFTVEKKALSLIPTPAKTNGNEHCNPQHPEDKGRKIQGHPQLHTKSKANLSYKRLCLTGSRSRKISVSSRLSTWAVTQRNPGCGGKHKSVTDMSGGT